MESNAGMRAGEPVGLTEERRSARAAEILGWWRAVRNDEWVGTGHGSPSA